MTEQLAIFGLPKGWYGTNQRQTVRAVSLIPEQIIGNVPCRVLDDDCDCRPYPAQCLPVFAEFESECTRNNDFSAFLFDFAGASGNDFRLQKYDYGTDTWADVASLNNNDYGILYNFGSFPEYPVRSGYRLSWQEVLTRDGAGEYRFIVYVAQSDPEDDFILYSLPFCLRPFSCDAASQTVRIESEFSGVIGNWLWNGDESILQQEFDLEFMTWTDQVRYHGYFGNVLPKNEQRKVIYSSGYQSDVYSLNKSAYILEIDRALEELIVRFSWYTMNSKKILLTSYHKDGGYPYDNFPVVAANIKEPKYYQYASGGFVWQIELEKAIQHQFSKRTQ